MFPSQYLIKTTPNIAEPIHEVSVIDRVTIISAIRHEPVDRAISLSQDFIDLVGVSGILVGQEMRHDHAALRIEAEVKFLPAATFLAMLGPVPFAWP